VVELASLSTELEPDGRERVRRVVNQFLDVPIVPLFPEVELLRANVGDRGDGASTTVSVVTGVDGGEAVGTGSPPETVRILGMVPDEPPPAFLKDVLLDKVDDPPLTVSSSSTFETGVLGLE
jgi:hypothetical protein